jgi:hypothetical protein
MGNLSGKIALFGSIERFSRAKALKNLSVGINSSEPNDKVNLNCAGGSEVPMLDMAVTFPGSPAGLPEEFEPAAAGRIDEIFMSHQGVPV